MEIETAKCFILYSTATNFNYFFLLTSSLANVYTLPVRTLSMVIGVVKYLLPMPNKLLITAWWLPVREENIDLL